MHAEFQVRQHAVTAYRVSDHRDIGEEFLLEPFDIAHIIHTFVEAPGEFGGDRLDGNAGIGDGRENQEKFRRSLGKIGLVHGDFGDEPCRIFILRDVAIDGCGLGHGRQVFLGGSLGLFVRDLERLVYARNLDAADEFGMTAQELAGDAGRRWLADGAGNVEGEEVAGGEKTVDCTEVNVVGVEIIGAFPIELANRAIGGGART